jgi:hypothetical protein
MNAVDAVRERLDACFILCSYAAPEIRNELGVQHLSQVWTRLPSWYIWLYDTPGAFMLELRGGALFSTNGISYKGAVGVIRYFPPADCTGVLNSEEATLRQSAAFDQTGTPAWEALAKIGGNELFVVGTFELHCPTESDDLLFLFEGTSLNPAENPGVQLFDRLVGMQAYAAQHAPSGPYTWRENGRAAAIGHKVSCEYFLLHYLASEQISAAKTCDAATLSWSALAGRTPVAAEGSGCCCCH